MEEREGLLPGGWPQGGGPFFLLGSLLDPFHRGVHVSAKPGVVVPAGRSLGEGCRGPSDKEYPGSLRSALPWVCLPWSHRHYCSQPAPALALQRARSQAAVTCSPWRHLARVSAGAGLLASCVGRRKGQRGLQGAPRVAGAGKAFQGHAGEKGFGLGTLREQGQSSQGGQGPVRVPGGQLSGGWRVLSPCRQASERLQGPRHGQARVVRRPGPGDQDTAGAGQWGTSPEAPVPGAPCIWAEREISSCGASS